MKKLYRSRDSQVIAGVCGGLGEYFEIDPVIFRIIFIVLSFVYGIGLIAYAIAWIVVPQRSEGEVVQPATPSEKSELTRYLPGLILIIVGAAFLLGRIWDWWTFRYVWPLALIGIGVYFIVRAMSPKKEERDAGK